MTEFRPIIEKDTVNMNELFSFFKRYFLNSLKFSLLIIFLYSVYFFIKGPIYKAEVTFYTSYNKTSNSSVFSFLPSNFGIEPENSLSFSIKDFLASESFLSSTVQKKFDIDNSKLTLVEHWSLNYNNFFILNPIALLLKVNSRLMDNNQITTDEKKIAHASRVLIDSINYSEDQDSQLYRIYILNDDSYLAYQIVTEIYNSIINYSNEITNIKGKEKREFINLRLEDIKTKLEQYENELLDFVEKNKDLSSPSLILEKDRMQQDVILLRQLYFTLSDQLEIAKIDEKDNTSSIFLLSDPHIKSKKDGLTLIEGYIFSIIVSFLVSYAFYFIKNRKVLISR